MFRAGARASIPAMMYPQSFRGILALIVFAFSLASPAWALSPDEILLLVNQRMPAGGELAVYYSRARLIPDNRILALDLPVSEQVSQAVYESRVVPVVRKFLRDHQLEGRIKCIVTFHGVPLRIANRTNTPAEKEELETLKAELKATIEALQPLIERTEAEARAVDESFLPGAGIDLPDLAHRADAAIQAMARALPDADGAERIAQARTLLDSFFALTGTAAAFERFNPRQVEALARDEAERRRWIERREDMVASSAEVNRLQDMRYDADSRSALRELVKRHYGLFGYARLLDAQIDYFATEATGASFDNELSLLWWDHYPRTRWRINPLHYRAQRVGNSPPVLMVSRLDGPDAGTVRDLILGSLKAERDGLRGRVVIDSNGGTRPNGKPDNEGAYAAYDRKLTDLSHLLSTKTKLSITLDDRPELIPPRSVRDVAIYTGWYSLRNYVPCCTFNLGAVAFHTASLEMVSLRAPDEKGWGAGLLRDGVVATVGAVAEPYLHAFPPPDEFFPLLMTGKLTLAEVYWKTTPLTSWMMTLIGDPLYTPYSRNPALKPEDLPAPLREALPASP